VRDDQTGERGGRAGLKGDVAKRRRWYEETRTDPALIVGRHTERENHAHAR
jgi:hypothetical protein